MEKLLIQMKKIYIFIWSVYIYIYIWIDEELQD